MQDALEGWWLRLIQGDEDAETAAADYYRAKADVAALERREERIEGRINDLEAEREEVRAEIEAARETVAETEDAVVASAAGGDGGAGDVESVAYDLLVDVAHDELGTNGVTAGFDGVQEGARRAGVEADEMIEEMRSLAEPVDSELPSTDDVVRRGFLKLDQDRRDRLETMKFDQVRHAVADVVLDEDDVEWERVPDDPADEIFGE